MELSRLPGAKVLNPSRLVRNIEMNLVPVRISVSGSAAATAGGRMHAPPAQAGRRTPPRACCRSRRRRSCGCLLCAAAAVCRRLEKWHSPAGARPPPPRSLQGPAGNPVKQLAFTAPLYSTRYGTYMFAPTLRVRAGDPVRLPGRRLGRGAAGTRRAPGGKCPAHCPLHQCHLPPQLPRQPRSEISPAIFCSADVHDAQQLPAHGRPAEDPRHEHDPRLPE